jgi:surface antigen
MTLRRIARALAVTVFCTALSFAVTAPAFSDGVIDPFGTKTYRLSDPDLELLKQAVRQALESQEVGTTVEWAGKQSKRTGRVTLLRVFQLNGMPCGEVEHVFTDGSGSRYVLPFCRAADGAWKVAF